VERDTRLLILRGAALAFWIGCVVWLALPTHGNASAPFHGGQPAQPKYSPAHSL